MTLVLRRFRPAPPLGLRRFGPDGRLAALAELFPAAPLPVAIGPPGPAGAQGAPGPAGQPTRIDFVAAATWIAAHSLGRVPMAIAYLASGEWVVADTTVTSFNLTVTHAQPQSGFVLLV